MGSIAPSPVESIRGHDGHGVLVGDALRLKASGRWSVNVIVGSEEEAREVMRQHGAQQFIERDQQQRLRSTR